MDDRIVEFIRGLRAAGVRVSVAESVDALNATGIMGISEKEAFKASLRSTLVKQADDFPAFEQLFPLYFGSGGPPLQNAMDELSEDEQNMLQAALSALSGRMQQLLDWLTSGNPPTKEQLEELARQAGIRWANNPGEAQYITRRMLRQMGFAHLEDQMRELMQKLQEMGMSQEAMEKLTGIIQANREALSEQIAQQIGLQIAQDRAERPDDLHSSDLMHKPFESLSAAEADLLRKEVQRLVAQLRSRAALRRKRGAEGKFDAKGTIRFNQRYGGVPLEIRYKKQKLKPSLVLICDVSRSMHAVLEFMLQMVYELHDQVNRVRSFAFYGDLAEITVDMANMRADEAVQAAYHAVPGGSYRTDLGRSLMTFHSRYLSTVDSRTTVMVLGDGRNNYNPSRVDLLKDIQRRAKRLVWFNPEPRLQWSSGDSIMEEYELATDEVYIIRNLAQLAAAIDKMMAHG
ncbi:MAG: VWA domain-containing protein [Anaerolineae bacterium]|nr:VWA domain-containing protein [Anaerolineae bacterium]